MAEGSLSVAIVGGGFTGSATALQLRSKIPQGRVTLFDRAGTFGRGLAYSTPHPEHLLNVPAGRMSLYPDRPDHFAAWLAAAANADPSAVAGTFAPRQQYGRYVSEEIAAAQKASDGRLELIAADVVDVVTTPAGFDIVTADRRTFSATHAVFSLGHAPAPRNNASCCIEPWADGALDGLDPAKPVLIVGTGLTMIDLALSLRRLGMKAPIFAVSRHGFLPQCHRASPAWQLGAITEEEKGSVRLLFSRLRSEAKRAADQGVAWQAVIDALRPMTQKLWQGFSDAEKRLFLRHVRSRWDVRRHRMAPHAAGVVEGMLRDRTLKVLKGHVAEIRGGADGAEVMVRPSGEETVQGLHVQRVFNATGLDRATEAPLIEKLLGRGVLACGPLNIGIGVDDSLKVLGPDRRPRPGLWALGPLVRGVFWECTAVPDIRVQAERLASAIASEAV